MKRKLFRWCVIFLVLFPAAPSIYSQCQAPQYRVGKILDKTVTAPTVIADISIRPEDFTPEKLVCLASALKQKFAAREIAVGIFSSHLAAVNYIEPRIEKGRNDDQWASQMHGEYYYNAERGQEFVLLMPDALSRSDKSPFNTRIDLPVREEPFCRLQIRDRCLLSFHHIYGSFGIGFGSIALTAQIEPNGFVSDIQIADPDAIRSSDEHTLADFAKQNLQSWYFEPSKAKDTIRIIYSAQRVDTPLAQGVDVQFTLPERVDIKIGPVLVTRP